MGAHNFSGIQKAAILLLSFGEEISSELFKHLTEFEIKRIGTAMSRLGRLEQETVDEVFMDFYGILQQNKQFFYGGSDYTRKVIGSAFKGGEAENLMEQLSLSSANLDSLDLVEAKTLAGFIRTEHPQTIALILAHLDPAKMSETIKNLPESLHSEVLIRLAKLDSVNPEIIEEIEDVLRHEVQSIGSISMSRLGGIEHVANMLNLVDKNTEESFLEGLEERNPEMAEMVKKLMFVFDDLVKLDDKSAQELIKAVPQEKWKIALKTASEGVKDLVFKNMSTRASEMLKEDMEAMSAVKISDVENVQLEILSTTRKLEAEGKIIISGGDTTYV